MNITPINNRINFCAIVLNQTEREKAQSTIAKLQTEPGYEQAGKNNLLQIFDRHIKKEVETRYGQAREKEDYYQTYYTALFEAISDNKSLDDILKEVNKPNVKENIIYSKYFPECPLSKSKMGNLAVNDLPVAISSPSQETVLQFQDKLRDVSKDLKQKEQEVLQNKAANVKLNSSERRVLKKAIAKIQQKNNVLPQDFTEKAQYFQEQLWKDKNIEEIIQLLIKHPELMAISKEKIEYNADKMFKVLELPQEDFTRILFKHPGLIYCLPETIEKNIQTNIERFKITKEQFVKASKNNPAILTQSAETLYQNVENGAKVFNIPLEDYLKVCLKAQMLFSIPGENMSERIDMISNILNISRESVIKSGILLPQVLCLSGDAIKSSAQNLSEILKIEDAGKLFVSAPQLFARSPESLKENIKKLSELFDLSYDETIKMIKKSPKVLSFNVESLNNKINSFAEVLNIPRKDIEKACKRHIVILNFKAETINRNVETTANELGLSKDAYVKSCLSMPSLLYLNPQKIIDNIKALAAGFEITKEEMAKIALVQPSVFYTNSKILFDNLDRASELLGDKDYRLKALKNPRLMCSKPETIKHKSALQNYFKSLIGIPTGSIALSSNSDEYLFCEMIRVLINKNNNCKIVKFLPKTAKNTLIDIIKSNPDGNYNFEIPDDKYAADKLIDFTKDFCNENFGKQIIKMTKYEDNTN